MQSIPIKTIDDIARLHDYLILAVPTFHKVVVRPNQRSYAADDCGSIVHDPVTGISTVSFSDDLNPIIIEAAISAYIGTANT